MGRKWGKPGANQETALQLPLPGVTPVCTRPYTDDRHGPQAATRGAPLGPSSRDGGPGDGAGTWPVVQCLSNRCQAKIIFTVTQASGGRQRMPVDADPVAWGEVLLLPNPADALVPISRVEKRADRRFGKRCYVSHFATCPDAGYFRRTL